MLSKSVYTTLPDGRTVNKYRITNDFGEYVEILEYGACIHSLCVLDKNGKLGDVVLGGRTPEEVTTARFAGATVGRCANRIAYGKFKLGGKTIQLECNRGGHHLHGASGDYRKKLFNAMPSDGDDNVVLHYTDTGEGGYNNIVEVTVRFTFGNDHRLKINYHMVGEEDTLLCPTNHAYFNLDGSPDILSHRLQIDALKYAVKGETGMPEGEQAEVADTPLDFRKLRPVGDALKPEYAPFYKSDVSQMDDIFLLSHNSGELDLVARLEGKESGRYMDVYTDMPALIVFTGFVKEPVVGKDEQVYSGYKSIALETQYVPNAVNCTGFDIPVFPAGTPLDSETIYAFGVIDD